MVRQIPCHDPDRCLIECHELLFLHSGERHGHSYRAVRVDGIGYGGFRQDFGIGAKSKFSRGGIDPAGINRDADQATLDGRGSVRGHHECQTRHQRRIGIGGRINIGSGREAKCASWRGDGLHLQSVERSLDPVLGRGGGVADGILQIRDQIAGTGVTKDRIGTVDGQKGLTGVGSRGDCRDLDVAAGGYTGPHESSDILDGARRSAVAGCEFVNCDGALEGRVQILHELGKVRRRGHVDDVLRNGGSNGRPGDCTGIHRQQERPVRHFVKDRRGVRAADDAGITTAQHRGPALKAGEPVEFRRFDFGDRGPVPDGNRVERGRKCCKPRTATRIKEMLADQRPIRAVGGKVDLHLCKCVARPATV